jgi:5'-AMP-activated protein kinase, catalytic alpha subunit
VAIKIINKKKMKQMGCLGRLSVEAKALKSLCHQNITQFHDAIDTRSDVFLVMEYCSGGDLFDTISKFGRLTELDSRAMFIELASALTYAHRQKISHRDLKVENLLFDSKGNLKLADFGLCQKMKDGHALTTACGSPDYVAPEILLN